AALAYHNRAALRRLPWAAIATVTIALGAGLAIAQPSGAIDAAQDTSWMIALIVTAAFEAGRIGGAPGVRGRGRGRRLGPAADRGAAEERDVRPRPGSGGVLHQLAHLRGRGGGRRLAVPAPERAPGGQPGRLTADAHRRGRADQHQLRRDALQ